MSRTTLRDFGAVSAQTRHEFRVRLTPWVGEVGSSQTEGPNLPGENGRP